MATKAGRVQVVDTESDWIKFMAQSEFNNILTFADFSSSKCEICQEIFPIFIEMSLKRPDARFIVIDTDKLKNISEMYDISATPTLIAFKGGKVVGRMNAANERKLRVLIPEPLALMGANTKV